MIEQEEAQDFSWHSSDTKEVLKLLKTRLTGLTTEEANKRLNILGYNELEVDKKKAKLLLLIAQFKSPIILILFAAALVSLIANKLISVYVILIVIIFNSLIGFFQEYKAEKSLEALKSMSAPEAEVLRDCTEFGGCTEKRIKAREIVPGDIILLETGDIIPADARLYETINLEIDEAVLTGESLPVQKHINILDEDMIVAERVNMIFSGTVVTKGRGKAIVVNTGINTELGKISQLLKETEKIKTPLQRRISRLGIFLALLAILFSSIVFIVGVLRGFELLEIFLFALSTMVSAIPEGLPAAISIALAIGVNKMAKKNAIVKKIQAIDTIGGVSVICTDKTGTLTTNQITAREILIEDEHISITGVGFAPEGIYEKNGEPVDIKDRDQLKNFLEIITLCNDSRLRQHELNDGYIWEIYGDPTEGSLIVASQKAGIHKELLEEQYPRIDEIPFTSEEKYMVTFHKSKSNMIKICVKGAPEKILNLCQKIIKNNSINDLTPDKKSSLLEQSNSLANKGLRVLGVAYQEIQISQLENLKRDILQEKSDLLMMGFIGMIDPPRPEVKAAIKTCKKAGIEVKMITGDHILTAKAIGKEIGLIDEGDKVIKGLDLDHLTKSELDEVVKDTTIFARVSPLNKFQIVRSLQKKEHVVAMTGDGVNDAPALKEADVGVAMGITGTDVTKEAADIVLVDDNFTSIVNAVEEGRVASENIKKIVRFLITTNISEIIIILISLIFLINHPLIFTSILILWVNLVTDGSLTITLAKEPKEEDIMNFPPPNKGEKILNRKLMINLLYTAAVMALGTIGMFLYGYSDQNLIRAQTMAFITLAMFQVFNALNCRSLDRSIFKIKIWSNRSFIVGFVISIILLILVTIIPVFQVILGTVAISIIDWIIVIIVSSVILLADEIRKIIERRKNTN